MSAADPLPLVLYAEDDRIIRELVTAMLEDAGFAVLTAESGTAAVRALGDRSFRLLITDINLGAGPDGWDVAKRARERDSALPVIYVAGAEAGDWQAKKVRNGVILTKPFVPDQLLEAVALLVAG